jgi:hypothetical protein
MKLLCATSGNVSLNVKIRILNRIHNDYSIKSNKKGKEKYFKQFDSFRYLTNKVDLSTIEAHNSFNKWHAKYLS